MSLNNKNIVISPNIGAAADPKIVFSGADASTTAQNITITAYPTSNGTLSFDGSTGQLFSVTNSMTGTIFSVNDVSGMPSIEVLDNGLVKIGQYSGNVLLGSGTDTGLAKLQVTGAVNVTGTYTSTSGSMWVGGNIFSAGVIQGLNQMMNGSDIQIINKAGNGWVNFATRNTAGSEAVYNLAAIGTLSATGLGTISVTSGTIITSGSHLKLENPTGTQSSLAFTFAGVPKGLIRLDSSGSFCFGSVNSTYYWGNDLGTASVAFALSALSIGGPVSVTGALSATGAVTGSNLSGTHTGSSSGTNTGDQTNISGNAVTTSQTAFASLSCSGRITGATGTGSANGYGFDSDTGMTSTGDGNLKFYSNNVYCGGPAVGSNSWDINITGSASNITAYTINQSVGTGNNPTFNNVYLPASEGNGYGFWAASDTYGIAMGFTAGTYQYGPVTDYSIKTYMSNTAGRGFTWGVKGSKPIAGLEVTTGNFQTTGNITAYSDKRLKSNIKIIPNALDKVHKLNGYTFDRTDINLRQTGVIAQELLEVLPEAVTGSEENHYAVAYGNMAGLFIEAIKEQQGIIDSQEERIARLEALINKLID